MICSGCWGFLKNGVLMCLIVFCCCFVCCFRLVLMMFIWCCLGVFW